MNPRKRYLNLAISDSMGTTQPETVIILLTVIHQHLLHMIEIPAQTLILKECRNAGRKNVARNAVRRAGRGVKPMPRHAGRRRKDDRRLQALAAEDMLHQRETRARLHRAAAQEAAPAALAAEALAAAAAAGNSDIRKEKG